MTPGANLRWFQLESLPPKCECLDTKITILSELEVEILKNLNFGRPFWKMADRWYLGQICDGFNGIIAPKCVCLDTKITILSELEAEILKNLNFGRPFWKMADRWDQS